MSAPTYVHHTSQKILQGSLKQYQNISIKQWKETTKINFIITITCHLILNFKILEPCSLNRLSTLVQNLEKYKESKQSACDLQGSVNHRYWIAYWNYGVLILWPRRGKIQAGNYKTTENPMIFKVSGLLFTIFQTKKKNSYWFTNIRIPKSIQINMKTRFKVLSVHKDLVA